MTVQKAFEERFAHVPGIMGIGLGVNATSTAPAINVQVESATAVNALPHTFRHLDVVVDVVGEVKAF